MRLIDFNRSTIDLHPALEVFWEHDHVTTPIVDILPATAKQIVLVSGAGHPLTLDQLRTRCQQMAPHDNLFIAADTPIRLYGYRLVPHQILLG